MSNQTIAYPKRPNYLPFLLLASGIVALFFIELAWGQVRVPFGEVWRILMGDSATRVSWDHIVRDFRLPRSIAALVCGGAVGITGLLLQTLFRNPLADAWALGVVHGARLGVACLVVLVHAAGSGIYAKFGLAGDVAIVVAAALGSLLAMLILQALAPRCNAVTLLILGLMMGYFFLGAISLILHFTDEAHGRVFEAWDDGSFSMITFNQLRIAVPLILGGMFSAFLLSKSLNALLLGERYAGSLGVNVVRVRRLGFLTVTILTAVVTGYCGPIAFLGIIVPHLARGVLRTSDHRMLIPACALVGGSLALATDWLVHLPWRQHLLHLNAVNGLLGAPVVFWVLLRKKSMIRMEG
jgi:iron complex transport system permease protein